MKKVLLLLLTALTACTHSDTQSSLSSVEQPLSAEEVVIENPNKKTTEQEKKKVIVHHGGVSPMDVIEFVDEYERNKENADEVDRAEKENIKRLLPPHTESDN